MGSEIGYAAFNLFIVLAVMVILFFLLKKFKLTRYGKQKFINVLQVVPVGAKEKIILVEAHNSFILLGATATHIETLHVFDAMASEEMAASVNKSEDEFTIQKSLTN